MTEETKDVLDPFEIRVLAVLAEKEALTPDNYPMSLNAIVTGCNQLSSRDPVMQLSEDTVQDTLQRLIERRLVNGITQAGARVTKYEHRMRIKWTLEQDKVAVLTVLMLRGLQTAGEIRTRTGRLHEFKSVGEAESALQFLIDKYPPLVAKLERAPGTKESRYGQLLGGEISTARDDSAFGAAFGAAASPASAPGSRVGQLEAEVAALRAEVSDLKAQFEAFRQQFQ
ncbi:YceH family protein [Massilia sp. YIM B02769]|uniref:YceH family protein n=1 Tax=unclassified Massilia TaxID=2609279 RepID=UPI0025B6654E|nr:MULTISPECIES: YceH family protein [unclassified Massilia]MDN4059946.1 YceH family protein [Massilia sp. YIM B02769]